MTVCLRSALHQHLVHIYTLMPRVPPSSLFDTVWTAFPKPHMWAISVDSTSPCPPRSDGEEEILGSLVCDVILCKAKGDLRAVVVSKNCWSMCGLLCVARHFILLMRIRELGEWRPCWLIKRRAIVRAPRKNSECVLTCSVSIKHYRVNLVQHKHNPQ